MSTSLGTSVLTISSERRTWRVNIECPKGGDYTLTAHRELIRTADDAVISRDQSAGQVVRSLSAVAGTISHECADGTVVAPEHIAEALTAFIEQWEASDLAPPVPAE